MGKETSSILKLLGVTAGIFFLTGLSMGSNSTDIHIHDTYFVMSSVNKFILFIVFSLFIGSLIASIFTKFKNKVYVRVLMFSFFLLFSAGIYIFSLFVKLK